MKKTIWKYWFLDGTKRHSVKGDREAISALDARLGYSAITRLSLANESAPRRLNKVERDIEELQRGLAKVEAAFLASTSR